MNSMLTGEGERQTRGEGERQTRGEGERQTRREGEKQTRGEGGRERERVIILQSDVDVQIFFSPFVCGE